MGAAPDYGHFSFHRLEEVARLEDSLQVPVEQQAYATLCRVSDYEDSGESYVLLVWSSH